MAGSGLLMMLRGLLFGARRLAEVPVHVARRKSCYKAVDILGWVGHGLDRPRRNGRPERVGPGSELGSAAPELR